MSMRQEPQLYALVDEANADEAYLASLSALYDPVFVHNPKRDRLRFDPTEEGSSLEEVLQVKRASLRHVGAAGTDIPFLTRSKRIYLEVTLEIERVQRARGDGDNGSRLLNVRDADILPRGFIIPESYDHLTIPVGAALLGHIWQEHMDHVFLAMCAPDAHSRVKRGAYTALDKFYGLYLAALFPFGFSSPLSLSSPYHFKKDFSLYLSFSFLYLH